MRLAGEWCKFWCCSVTPHTQPTELLVVSQSLKGEGLFREISWLMLLSYFIITAHISVLICALPLWSQCLKWQSHPIAQSWAGMYIVALRNRFRFEVFISELDCCEITIKPFNFVVHSGSKWSEVLDEFFSELVYTAKCVYSALFTVPSLTMWMLFMKSICGSGVSKLVEDQD